MDSFLSIWKSTVSSVLFPVGLNTSLTCRHCLWWYEAGVVLLGLKDIFWQQGSQQYSSNEDYGIRWVLISTDSYAYLRTFILFASSIRSFFHPFPYTMFCLNLCSSAISLLSQQSYWWGFILLPRICSTFLLPSFSSQLSKPAHPSVSPTSQLFDELDFLSLTPSTFHIVFSNFMLLTNEVFLFWTLLFQPQSFCFISHMAFQAQMQFLISTLFVTYFFSLWKVLFSPHRLVSVCLPRYQGLGLPPVHLHTCVYPPCLSALDCVHSVTL